VCSNGASPLKTAPLKDFSESLGEHDRCEAEKYPIFLVDIHHYICDIGCKQGVCSPAYAQMKSSTENIEWSGDIRKVLEAQPLSPLSNLTLAEGSLTSFVLPKELLEAQRYKEETKNVSVGVY